MVGEREDFEDWYQAMHPRLLGVLCAVSADPDAAAEATDEAFARALFRWDRVRAMASPEGWTYRVALNLLRRRKRRAAMEVRLRRREGVVDAPCPAGEVWDEVRRLPERQRTAIVLRYVGDLPEAEIAAAMGVTRGTVASTLADARRRLATTLTTQPPPSEVSRDGA
jgi:DNA-directed RNA polymerase specialized sigma24 family protein